MACGKPRTPKNNKQNPSHSLDTYTRVYEVLALDFSKMRCAKTRNQKNPPHHVPAVWHGFESGKV